MTKLSVNINKVALLRNSRALNMPDVIQAAEVCIAAGAEGITVHPRPDGRHILHKDVYMLAGMLTVEFNIEGNPVPEFMQLIRRIRPTQCTLVPDDPNQKTSDHGWQLKQDGERLKPILKELKDLGVRSSLFMDPEAEAMERAKEIGADRVELYTEPYALAFSEGQEDQSLRRYRETAEKALSVGLALNAGHDLNQENLAKLLTEVKGIEEVSIGHALISDAIFDGLDATVRAYRKIIAAAFNGPQ